VVICQFVGVELKRSSTPNRYKRVSIGLWGFAIAATGAAFAYFFDPGTEEPLLAVCFVVVLVGVAIGFYGVIKGWRTWNGDRVDRSK